jgi:hypothetical protein
MTSKLVCSIVALFALASSAACGNGASTMEPRGSASASWSITVAGHSTTCAHVGAASVSLRLHRGSGADVTSAFPCTDTEGTMSPVTPGAYDATLTLHANDGATLATAPSQGAITIGADQVTALAPVAFTADGRGKLLLSLATLSTRTNCAARDQGGAGITGSRITLVHAADGCAPVTFTRSRGTTTLGTYMVNCSSPQVTGCIERDETLTIDGLDSGPYVISVGALVGPIQCWAGDDVLSVPAGASLVKRIQLAPTAC